MKKKVFVASDTWFNLPPVGETELTTYGYNNDLIEKWNSVVDNDSIVYVLGGFGIGDLYEIVSYLNGDICFLNSFFSKDEQKAKECLCETMEKSLDEKLKKRITFSTNQMEVLYDNDLVLSYCPLAEWIGKNYSTLHFHGMETASNMRNGNMNCNVKNWDMKPVDVNVVKGNINRFMSML